MVVTGRPEWAVRLRRLRDWGQAGAYRHVERGFNFRMAGIQGAVLGVKLRHLEAWTESRRSHAAQYDAALDGPELTAIPVEPWVRHVYHIYAVRARHREVVQAEFRRRGVESRVHYPSPIHLVDAWCDLGYRAGSFPHAERAAREVLSLPVHPELTPEQVAVVADALRNISQTPAEAHRGSMRTRRRQAAS
jgi:dTDP-4-amino-4,6-dideoxygalactose transaminase